MNLLNWMQFIFHYEMRGYWEKLFKDKRWNNYNEGFPNQYIPMPEPLYDITDPAEEKQKWFRKKIQTTYLIMRMFGHFFKLKDAHVWALSFEETK